MNEFFKYPQKRLVKARTGFFLPVQLTMKILRE